MQPVDKTWIAVLIVLVTLPIGGPARGLDIPAFSKGRIIVKYKGAAVQAAAERYESGKRFKDSLGSSSLDALHERRRVSRGRRLGREGRIPGMRKANFQGRALRAAGNAGGAGSAGLSNVYVLELATGEDETAAAREFSTDPNVEYAQTDGIVRVSFEPNDPYFGSARIPGQSPYDLWGLKKVEAGLAWERARGAGILVAVVDTGVDYNHPDIRANMWTNPADGSHGYNFAEGNNDPLDLYGHGTHVAGIIAATGNNALGILGLAFDSRIMALKALGNDGTGLESNVAGALAYAVDQGADIINLSLTAPGESDVLRDAVQYAYSQGVIVVVSAGNAGKNLDLPENASFPAASPQVLTVSASDMGDSLAVFSNYGGKIDAAAPGAGILSLRAGLSDLYGDGSHIVGTHYLLASGTSMATAFVSGLAALLLSQRPQTGIEEVRRLIRQTGAPLGGLGPVPAFSFRRINAKDALERNFSGAGVGPLSRCDGLEAGETYSYPNPAAKNPKILAKVGLADDVQLNIYNEVGQKIRAVSFTEPVILEGLFGYAYDWDTQGVPSGIYLYAFEGRKHNSSFLCAGKISLLK